MLAMSLRSQADLVILPQLFGTQRVGLDRQSYIHHAGCAEPSGRGL